MTAPIDFYFDFGSPYGYFASHLIDEFASRYHRTVAWHPILIGAAFKVTGSKPLVEQGPKGDYSLKDWVRMARQIGIPWTVPEAFPIGAVAASRGFYWIAGRDPTVAKLFARAVYHLHFGEGRDIRDSDLLAKAAKALGVDGAAFLAGIQDQAIKDKLREETDKALARGVFGSPFFFVDGEPFWGCDRLPMMADWLEKGGW